MKNRDTPVTVDDGVCDADNVVVPVGDAVGDGVGVLVGVVVGDPVGG